MNEQIEQNSLNNNFKLWTRWFWVGIIVAAYHVVAGLVFGLVLVFEKDRRLEGLIILLFAVVWFAFGLFWFAPWISQFFVAY
jgi:hypothetical protein